MCIYQDHGQPCHPAALSRAHFWLGLEHTKGRYDASGSTESESNSCVSAMTQTKPEHYVKEPVKPHPRGSQISLAALSFYDWVAMTAQCSRFPMKPAYTQ